MSGNDTAAFHTAFIERNTERVAPPLVPELRLHLATETTRLWQSSGAELERDGIQSPFWAFAWPGGQALARYIIDHPHLVAGRRVLDLGAGSGIVSLAALWASASVVIANDTDPAATAAIALNAETNGLASGLEIVARDMLEEPVLAEDGSPLFDTVLAGDLLYENSLAARVMEWLERHAAAGADVLFGDPGRHYMPDTGTTLCASYTVPVSVELEDSQMKETGIWRVLPAAGENAPSSPPGR